VEVPDAGARSPQQHRLRHERRHEGDGAPAEFLIAGADKNFLPADVKIEKDKIVVFNKDINSPAAVRFSFSNTGMSNVFNKEGLPIVPFRTDTWEVVPVKQ